MRSLTLFAAVLLAGCTTAGSGMAAPAPEVSPVSLTVYSWGRPVKHWAVGANGAGELWRIEDRREFFNYDVAKYGISLDSATLAALDALLDRLRAQVAGGIACDMRISDAPYGELRWSDGGEPKVWHFNEGCLSDEARQGYQTLADATTLIESRATIDRSPFAKEHVGPK